MDVKGAFVVRPFKLYCFSTSSREGVVFFVVSSTSVRSSWSWIELGSFLGGLVVVVVVEGEIVVGAGDGDLAIAIEIIYNQNFY